MNYIAKVESPLGLVTVTSDGESITGLWLPMQMPSADAFEAACSHARLPVLEDAEDWLADYFAAKKPELTLPLAPSGNEFRQAVWSVLLQIPYGELTTYGEVADKVKVRMGKTEMSAQAIGYAVGHNPISIMIPCHRVVGAGGDLTGYSGGIEYKKKLLEIEGVDMEKLHDPKK
ncbi:MAG: methylated-DNA--[protein]-cysteine S-methyltransferase [Eubacteriales bacterium]|nr:methylated-DNA--[protein]-cysteine S-methyltransferase [Eubacteriales bacterium]MDD3880627.1 methylated-DNA--[protein]-cysteine S-methyltransferase [Eubacteriales bacterium]MDD4513533.1 methylated-DNA--[protein]-cysteine S-methyltransferase [Eubacteriales bacterium]